MANIKKDIITNGTTTLATAGKYCDRNIEINVNVPVGTTPTGTKSITTNGTHDVTNYASANVNVPIPSGYIKPSGSKTITTNGTHDVTSVSSAVVNVPQATPAQFTNLLKQSSTIITINQLPHPSTVGAYSASNGSITVELTIGSYNTGNRPKFRFRGYILQNNYFQYSLDGGSTWAIGYWYGNYSNRSIIDEYGDVSVQPMIGSNSSNLVMRIPLIKGAPRSSSSDAIASVDAVRNSGAIMTINEAIGNGGTALLDATLDGTIKTIDSNVSNVISYACYGIESLETVNLPNATDIGSYSFRGCTGITEFNAPNATSLGNYMMYGCSNIKRLVFQKGTSAPANGFQKCSALEYADFHEAKSIASSAFANCTKLKALILRYDKNIVTVTSNSFSGISSYSGHIYVPSALIDTYLANSTWKAFTTRFRALEDYTVDGTITGEIDSTKVII
jgi:hypothetical protein